ncbi:ABC transporter permease, partial [Acidianus sp. RZ1]|uniref:ABC transporter permease n=1 Tax=Acidianus sp. RZ1 TaxID=1540082 RepID=UPI0014918FDD
MNPLIYDFRRTFLRFSVLFFLAIFILAGIGIVYSSYSSIAKNITQKTNMIAGIWEENGTNIIGYIFNNQGDGVSGKVEVLVNGSLIGSTSTQTGYFRLKFPLNGSELSKDLEKGIKVVASTSLGYVEVPFQVQYIQIGAVQPSNQFISIVHENISVNYFNSYLGYFGYAPNNEAFSLVDGKLIFLYLGNSSEVNYSVYYGYSNLSEVSVFPVSQTSATISKTLMFAGTGEGISIFHVKMSKTNGFFTVKLVLPKSNEASIISSRYSALIPLEVDVMSSFPSGVSLFATLFPIIFLYLVYSMISKPLGSGAMEFLLARPITRDSIYINRFIAGTLTAILSSGILTLSIGLTISLLYGISPPFNFYGLIFLGITGDIMGFFSLYTLLAILIKKTSGYLGLSIVFYLIFTIF